jgi:hypothetical protein
MTPSELKNEKNPSFGSLGAPVVPSHISLILVAFPVATKFVTEKVAVALPFTTKPTLNQEVGASGLLLEFSEKTLKLTAASLLAIIPSVAAAMMRLRVFM